MVHKTKKKKPLYVEFKENNIVFHGRPVVFKDYTDLKAFQDSIVNSMVMDVKEAKKVMPPKCKICMEAIKTAKKMGKKKVIVRPDSFDVIGVLV